MKLSKRIKQVQSYELPIIVRSRNSIPNTTIGVQIELFQYLAGGIPELIIPNGIEDNPFCNKSNAGDKTFTIREKFAENLARAVLGTDMKQPYPDIAPKGISIEMFKRGGWLNSDHVETHAFYDPLADMTYFFPWPARSILP